MTDATIQATRDWTEQDAAAVLCDRYRAVIRTKTELFVEMGLLLLEIERRELWRYDSSAILQNEPAYHSMDDWITRASGTSNRSAYAALKAAKALSHIPVAERNEIPRCNQSVLAKLSPAVSADPAVRETAKNGSNDQLLEKIERDHPNQHLERLRPMRFSPERSQRAVIDEALKMLMVVEELPTREAALEFMAAAVCEAYRERYYQVTGGEVMEPIPATGSIQ